MKKTSKLAVATTTIPFAISLDFGASPPLPSESTRYMLGVHPIEDAQRFWNQAVVSDFQTKSQTAC